MKNQPLSKTKNRKLSGGFAGVPHIVLESENWAQCSGMAVKLLMDLLSQFKGGNNGDLCAALTVMGKKGWTRGQTISIAVRELIHYGLIEMTRQGGLHRASLYAVTWLAIDFCKGKLDVPETNLPSSLWKITKSPFQRPIKKRLAAKRPMTKPKNGTNNNSQQTH